MDRGFALLQTRGCETDMFIMLNDVSSYRTSVESFLTTNIIVNSTAISGPDGKTHAWKCITNSLIPSIFEQLLFNPAENIFKQGAWLWTDSGQPFYGYKLVLISGFGDFIATAPFSISTEPVLHTLAMIDTFANSWGSVYMRFDGPTAPTSGDYFYIWMPHLAYAEGYLDVEPGYDFLEHKTKIENSYRARSGDRYVYKWSEVSRYKFSVSYVDSTFKTVVNNSYWNDNANLIFANTPGGIFDEVQLTNKQLPIGQPVKPYDDLFKGIINLETY